MKKLTTLLFCITLSLASFAIPARPGARQVTGVDGSTLTIYAHGDEMYHYYTNAEGYLVERNEQGVWEVTQTKQTESSVKAHRAARSVRYRAASKKALQNNLITKGLVVLVQFSDVKFKEKDPQKAFNDLLNGDNYDYNGATGSVKEYYKAQSSGQFVPSFDVYGPITLTGSMSSYGGNDRQGNDKGVGKMVAQACQLAYETYNIDLSKYDADNDGYVDFVDILYAGYGEADYEDENAVWPCEWSLSDSDYRKTLTLGNTRIDLFSCHQELDGYTGQRAGIGTPCHEFGHVFGLPDFYDTEYEHVTLGYWDLMDAGAYNNDGNTPPGFSGYERMFAGWAKPRLVNETGNFTLQELQDSQDVIVISETGTHNLDAVTPNPKTFYVLENRQQKSWDTYLPGHGMLIWKIQYNATEWYNNTVNNHELKDQGVAIMAADGAISSHSYLDGSVAGEGDEGDPFPGAKKITSYSGISGYGISKIAENNGTISLTITASGSVTPPNPPVNPSDEIFEKVTSALSDWSGQYLIVNEDASVALDGSLEKIDAKGNYVSVTIQNNTINANTEISFTVEKAGDSYYIKNLGGQYIGLTKTDVNSLEQGTTPYSTEFSFNYGNVEIISSASGAHLRYNATQEPPRFRFYKAATYDRQKAIQLYRMKANSGTSVTTVTNSEIQMVAGKENLSISGISTGAEVYVYNITGSLVASLTANSATLDIPLNSGIYIVRVADLQASATRKVIVR